MPDEIRLTRDFLAEGLTSEDLRRAARAGRLQRVRRGAYATPDRLSPRDAHLRLALTVAAQRTHVVLSHVTAAAAWGLPVDSRSLGRVWVTRLSAGHGRLSQDVVEVAAPLAADALAVYEGVPMTGVARTVLDVARAAPFEWGVAAADAALHQGLCSRDDLAALVDEARGWRGVARARAVLAFANQLAESPLESISRVQFARMSLPMPAIQMPILLDGRFVARCDFGWEEQRLVGEADGLDKYSTLLPAGTSPREAIAAEKAREGKIRAAGWWIVRWGMADALDAQRLAQIVRPHLQIGDFRPGPRPLRW